MACAWALHSFNPKSIALTQLGLPAAASWAGLAGTYDGGALGSHCRGGGASAAASGEGRGKDSAALSGGGGEEHSEGEEEEEKVDEEYHCHSDVQLYG